MGEQLYRSNCGRGPLVARITSVSADGRIATMERWHEKRPRQRTTFKLALRFLAAPGCGWRKAN